MIGTKLANYEITSHLGSGGMGEVFRARDTKLGREVALKILPEAFASEPDRLARFQREAQVLAALNHTSIAAIFGLEESGNTTALVLELVEGPTLADRIRGGRIPVDETLGIAKQIAEALEAAHEKGIMHRDLKPANIKVTPDGKVKVLDFGLAKIFTDEPANMALSQSPTLMSAASTPGMILGTAAYMSPEQARGKTVDKRTDIWAFGAVLFEMLSGSPAFDGETVTDVLGAIVHKEPAWEKLPSNIPAPMLRLFRRCLAKDARQRLHDIADARIEIEAAVQEPDIPEPARNLSRRLLLVPGIVIVVLLAVIVALLTSQHRATLNTATNPGPLIHTEIDLPTNAPLATHGVVVLDSPAVAVSPDGTQLVYVGQVGNDSMLYQRRLADPEVRPVAGTEGAIFAFFSPDGRWLGFLTNHKVKKVRVEGGTPVTLSGANTPVQAWWTRNDVIHFSEDEGFTLSQVPVDGGPVTRILESGHGTFSDVFPNGKFALRSVSSHGISTDYGEVELLSLDKRDAKTLIRSGYGARYVPPGFLVFARAGNLLAVRFDLDRLEVQGEPVPLLSGVGMESFFAQVQAAYSQNGMLAFVPGSDRAIGKLAWVDRNGKTEFLEVPPRLYGVVIIAPDGKRLAVHVADVMDYVWVYDFARREGRRLTSAENNGWPVWSPDGSQMAFTSFDALSNEKILIRDVDGGNTLRAVLSGKSLIVSSWSPDGRTLGVSRINKILEMGFVTLDGKAD